MRRDGPAGQLRTVAFPPLILRKHSAVEALGFPYCLHVPQRFHFVALGAHELIGLCAPPSVRSRMLADQTLGLFAIADATRSFLPLQQCFVLACGQIETAHVETRFFER